MNVAERLGAIAKDLVPHDTNDDWVRRQALLIYLQELTDRVEAVEKNEAPAGHADSFGRVADLGKELIGVAEKMRVASGWVPELRDPNKGYPDRETWGLCEARVIGIAAELRVIMAGTRGI